MTITCQFVASHLALQYLRAHAGIDADEDDPALVLAIGDDEGSAPLPNVDATRVLLRHGVPHLHETEG